MLEPTPERRSERPGALRSRLTSLVLSLGILAAAWYLLKLDTVIAAALLGGIVVTHAVPMRFSRLAGGVCTIGVAGVIYQFYGASTIALVVGAVGLVSILTSIGPLRTGAPD